MTKRKCNVLKVGGRNLDPENWKVFHPDGTHMFTCGGKKARWYISRDLAVIKDVFEMQLTFEPEGIGFSDNEEFGKSIRETKCVVSGAVDDLQRHHIVPYCYRTHFTEKYKSKNHHDVVLMNRDRHSEYEQEATKYKDILSEKYEVKKIGEYNRAYSKMLREFSHDKHMVLSKIMSMLRRHGELTKEKVQNNFKYISEKTEIDYVFLIKCNYIQLYKLYLLLSEQYKKDIALNKQRHSKYYDHGWHLVQKLDTHEKIAEFVKLWREHFIKVTSPQYMPNGWSVDFRFKTKLL